MAIQQVFYDALKRQDKKQIRVLLENSLNLDRTFADFEVMEKQAQTIPGLYDAYNGEELPRDKSQWNEKFLARQLAKLAMNFCPEGIAYIKEIITYLYPEPTQKKQAPSPEERKDSRDTYRTNQRGRIPDKVVRPKDYNSEKEKDRKSGNILMAAGCAAGGGVIGYLIPSVVAAEKVAAATIIGSTAAGIFIGGALGLFVTRR